MPQGDTQPKGDIDKDQAPIRTQKPRTHRSLCLGWSEAQGTEIADKESQPQGTLRTRYRPIQSVPSGHSDGGLLLFDKLM